MRYKLSQMFAAWLEYRKPTLEGERYTIDNPLEFVFKKNGIARLSNGYEIPYDQGNKEDIIEVIKFTLRNGIRFGDNENQWKLYPKEGIIETHQGIRFKINSVGLLDEAFLNQTHFSEFDLKDRVVVTGGAYKGDTPLFYSYYGAKVYGFEPDPTSYNIALDNIKLNPELSKNIVLMNYAISGDEDVLFPLNYDSGGSSLYKIEHKRTVRIKSVSISTILKDFSILNPYLLDLDIKGAEFSVIEDSSISSFQKIRIEYSPYLLNPSEKNLGYLVSKLKGYGFNKIRVYKHNDRDRFDLLNHGVLEAKR